MENSNYTPKVGELVFTNCGSASIKRENVNLVPWKHIHATFCNDKGNVFSVGFKVEEESPYDFCTCSEAIDRSRQHFCEKRKRIWLNRAKKVEKAKERKGIGFWDMDKEAQGAILAYHCKADRIISNLNDSRWLEKSYKNYDGMCYSSFEGNVYVHKYAYDYRIILRLINRVFGCSYTSIRTDEQLPSDTICQCM